jgi:hypothetical protein
VDQQPSLDAARLQSAARIGGDRSPGTLRRARRERRRSERLRAASLQALAGTFAKQTLDQVAPLCPLDELDELFLSLQDVAEDVADHCLASQSSERTLTLVPRPVDD